MIAKIFKLTLLVNGGLLLGRMLGFVREIIIAERFGASWHADVTVTILTLPDILINILLGGALTAALVPSFTADKRRSRALAYQVSVVIFLVFSVISALLALQSALLVRLLAPGYSGQVAAVAETGVTIVVLLLPLFVLTGVTTALLQAWERFAVPSLGSFFFNLVLVAGLWLATQQDTFNIYFIIFSVLAAGSLRYISQLAVVRPGGHPLESFRPWLISWDLIRRYWQAMLSGGMLFIYPVMARAYASMVGEGGVAMFSYAMKLIELPLLLCVSFLGVVLMPRLSEAYRQNREMFTKLVVYGLHAVFALGTVAVTTLFVGRQGYTQLVYGRGLRPEIMDDVTYLVGIGLLCVLFQGAVTFMAAAFNAARKTQLPLVMNLVGGAYLLAVLQFSSNKSLCDIMIVLTSTYGFLAIIYSMAIGRSLLITGMWGKMHTLRFFASALIVNTLVAVGHWLLLSSVKEVWLSFFITVLAGGLALVATALCHHALRERLFRMVN